MPLSLHDARRIAGELVAEEYPSLRVVGAAAEGGANYTEIILTVAECHAEPCRITVGVDREATEASFRRDVSQQIHRHIQNPVAWRF